MTKSLLTIALAAATLPLSFAAPQATSPAPKSDTAQATTPKKHAKKVRKNKKQAASHNATASKPAAK